MWCDDLVYDVDGHEGSQLTTAKTKKHRTDVSVLAEEVWSWGCSVQLTGRERCRHWDLTLHRM